MKLLCSDSLLSFFHFCKSSCNKQRKCNSCIAEDFDTRSMNFDLCPAYSFFYISSGIRAIVLKSRCYIYCIISSLSENVCIENEVLAKSSTKADHSCLFLLKCKVYNLFYISA